jgi:oligoribonuclease (3'-5' exoribonuclease)
MDATTFDEITDDAKIIEVATNMTEEVIKTLGVGDVVAFKTDDDRLGLYRVTALTGEASGSITITVKVQKP